MGNAWRRRARWLLTALPFTLALVYSNSFSPPFSAPKNAILLLSTALLAALALICAPVWKPERDERWFWIAAAAFLAINLVAALDSHRPALSVLSFEWTICGALLFAACLGLLAGEDRATAMRKLQVSVTASAVLVSLVVVAQFLAIQLPGPFGVYTNSTRRMRMIATLGNPDFVAAFLAVALPSAIALALQTKKLRSLSITASVLIGASVILTGSRAGVVAMAAGATVVVCAAMHRQTWSRLAVVAMLLAACSTAIGTHFNARTPFESLRGRVLIWQVSLGEAAAQQPLGSGPGTFAYEYPLSLGRFFAQPGHDSLLYFASHERHAQNDFVEAWHDTGWLGLAGLLALLATWFALVLRRLCNTDAETRPAVAAAIASVTALCVASLADFPMHRAETWALLSISMAVPLVKSVNSSAPRPRLAWLRYAGAVLIVAVGSCLALAPLAASYELAKGESEEGDGQLQPALAAYRAALRWEPSSPDANFNLVRATANAGDISGALTQSTAAATYVDEPELYLLRSRILANAGRDAEALSELQEALPRFPYSKALRNEAATYAPPKPAVETSE